MASMFSHMLDQDPERFDRQTQGVVVSCVDKTDRTRATRENGGFMLVFQIKAEYQVDGVTYTCKETGGSPRKVGSTVTITYNSTKPSDSTLNTDPVAGKKRVDELVVGSGIALVFCLVPLVVGYIRKPEKRM